MRILPFTFLFCYIITSCTDQKVDSETNEILTSEKRISFLFKLESKQGSLLTCDEETLLYKVLPKNFKEYKNFFCVRHQLNDGRKLYLTRALFLFENSYCLEREIVIDKLFEWSNGANVFEGCETFSKGSSGGYFDAVIILQELVQRHFSQNVTTSINVFKQKEENEILSFWRFYFDGPHPESYKEDFKVLYTRYAEKDQRIADLMKQSYEQLLKESDGHGQ